MNVKLVAVLLVLVMCVPVSAVGFQSAHATDGSVQSNDGLQIADDGTVSPVKQVMPETVPAGTDYSDTPSDHSSACTDHCDSQYNEGTILVKDSSFSEDKLGELEYVRVEPLFAGSDWQLITLNERTDTAGSVGYLRSLGVFEQVDYDYIMGADGTIESIGVEDNPSYSSQNYIETMCIDQGWLHLYDNNIFPGGNSSVIVAVIDTLYPIMTRYAIDHHVNPGGEPTLDGIWLFALGYVALILVQTYGTMTFIKRSGDIEMAISYDIRQEAFLHLQNLSFSFYDKTSVG